MKIISFILAASILMAGCASKHKAGSTGNSANAGNKKAEKTTEPSPKPAEKPAPPPAPAKDMYTAIAEVSLRITPNPTSRILMKIMKGEQVELLEKVNDNWWKIKYRDEPGYADPKTLAK